MRRFARAFCQRRQEELWSRGRDSAQRVLRVENSLLSRFHSLSFDRFVSLTRHSLIDDHKTTIKIDKPGSYRCNLPIVVNNNFENPYYNIEVVGELLSPEIHFEPDILILKPVPLGVEIVEQVLIKQRGYERLLFFFFELL